MISYSSSQSKFKPSGFSALLVVLIIGTVSLAVAQSATFLGLGEMEIGYTSQHGNEALTLADGCLDETMRRIRLNTNYGLAGEIDLSIASNSCTINVSLDPNFPGDVNRRLIVAVGKISDFYKGVSANLSLNGNVITLVSWQEVNN